MTSENGVSKFSFKHLEITKDQTIPYDMSSYLGPGRVIYGRPAMEANPDYRNAVITMNSRRDRSRKITAAGQQKEDEALDRLEDIPIFSETVLTGWECITDEEGNEAPFSVENCKQFLAALPDWLFDRVRVHFKLPDSFTTSPPSLSGVGETAGN